MTAADPSPEHTTEQKDRQMSTPSPERIKAFLDDMALLCMKHGIGLVEESCGKEFWLEVEELNEQFAGFEVCYGSTFSVFDRSDAPSKWVTARSVDVSTITAHKRIALTRSLARVEG